MLRSTISTDLSTKLENLLQADPSEHLHFSCHSVGFLAGWLPLVMSCLLTLKNEYSLLLKLVAFTIFCKLVTHEDRREDSLGVAQAVRRRGHVLGCLRAFPQFHNCHICSAAN